MKDNVILTNMNYDDLILKDRFYLVILIITITYSNKNFQLKWNCSECQTANGHHLEMDSIFISDVSDLEIWFRRAKNEIPSQTSHG